MSNLSRTRETIGLSRPLPVKLLLFWVLVFLLPALVVFIMLRLHLQRATEKAFIKDSFVLQNEIELFEQDLVLEKVIPGYIFDSMKEIRLLLPETLDDGNLDHFCKDLAGLFAKKYGAQPILALAGQSKSGTAGFFADTAGGLSLGRRTASIIIQNIGETKTSAVDPVSKRFNQIRNSIFGDLVELPESPGTLKAGFLTKKNPDKVLIAYEILKINNDRPLKLLLFFSERSFNTQDLFAKACQNASPGVKRELMLLEAAPEREFKRTADHELHFFAPLKSEMLRIGSHQKKSWYSFANDSGLSKKRPTELPFMVVSTLSGRHSVKLFKFASLIHLSLLLISFLGLGIVKKLLEQRLPGNSLHTRFRVAILASTVLPFAVFFTGTHQFMSHFDSASIRSKLQNLRNELILLEMSIKNNDSRKREEVNREIRKLMRYKSEDIKAFANRLNAMYGRIFEGYSFIRNDGKFSEKLPPGDIAVENDYNKLLLVRDLILAQAYNIFERAGVLLPESESEFMKIPGFVSWRAFKHHFTETDLNSFCRNDGRFYPARQADSGHFMIASYNMFAEHAEDKLWALLMLVIDRKKFMEDYLSQQTDRRSFFLKREGDSLIHLAVLICHDNTLEEIDRSKAWPMNVLDDKELLNASRRINSRKMQTSWLEEDKNGIVRLYAARALSEIPVKLVARSEISESSKRDSLVSMASLVFIIYSMLLIYLIGSVLSQTFISPLNLLLTGINELENNRYPQLEHKSDNEFASLIQDFNAMTTGLKQRKLLDRFISQEVTRTVASETIELSADKTTTVFRVIVFIHIRDFDNICETLSPEKSISLLNHYFSHFEPLIKRYEGQIDKYIGDAIMISFSPDNSVSAEHRAAGLGLQCLATLAKLNEVLKQADLPEILIGTGIASGMVILGRIGSRSGRQDFTYIGDAVNLAARLESMSHSLADSAVLVSDTAAEKLTDKFKLSLHGEVAIRGKAQPARVFQLTGVTDV